MGYFEALVLWYNNVVGTQKLVWSHVLGQTQWWSLTPKSSKNFGCPTYQSLVDFAWTQKPSEFYVMFS